MNLFCTSKDPRQAAQDHCDKHLMKMLLETAQLLSTAHHLEGDPTAIENLYKVTHENHPSAVWSRSSAANYTWTYDLFVALCDEYTRRYGRTHLTETKLRASLATPPCNITRGVELTPPPACMDDEFKVHLEGEWPIESYRLYLAKGKPWLKVDSFKKRGGGAPAWFRRLAEVSS